MTDYLEEVLEEETEDRKEFQPKRVVVRGPRRERPDVQEEDGAEGTKGRSDGPDRTLRDREIPMEDRAEEESALLRDLSRNRRKAVPGEKKRLRRHVVPLHFFIKDGWREEPYGVQIVRATIQR